MARTRHLLHKEYRVPKIFASSFLLLFPLRFPSSSIKLNRRPPVSRGHETFVDEKHKYGFLLTQVNRVWPAGSTGICTVLFGRRFQTGEGGVVILGSFFSPLSITIVFSPLEDGRTCDKSARILLRWNCIPGTNRLTELISLPRKVSPRTSELLVLREMKILIRRSILFASCVTDVIFSDNINGSKMFLRCFVLLVTISSFLYFLGFLVDFLFFWVKLPFHYLRIVATNRL